MKYSSLKYIDLIFLILIYSWTENIIFTILHNTVNWIFILFAYALGGNQMIFDLKSIFTPLVFIPSILTAVWIIFSFLNKLLKISDKSKILCSISLLLLWWILDLSLTHFVAP